MGEREKQNNQHKHSSDLSPLTREIGNLIVHSHHPPFTHPKLNKQFKNRNKQTKHSINQQHQHNHFPPFIPLTLYLPYSHIAPLPSPPLSLSLHTLYLHQHPNLPQRCLVYQMKVFASYHCSV